MGDADVSGRWDRGMGKSPPTSLEFGRGLTVALTSADGPLQKMCSLTSLDDREGGRLSGPDHLHLLRHMGNMGSRLRVTR